jgi:hypothetical protein
VNIAMHLRLEIVHDAQDAGGAAVFLPGMKRL